MASNERRIELTGNEARAVYERLIPEGGEHIALGKWIRAASHRGQRSVITPNLTRHTYKRIRLILREAKRAK